VIILPRNIAICQILKRTRLFLIALFLISTTAFAQDWQSRYDQFQQQHSELWVAEQEWVGALTRLSQQTVNDLNAFRHSTVIIVPSLPVGRITSLYMYSLNRFSQFLAKKMTVRGMNVLHYPVSRLNEQLALLKVQEAYLSEDPTNVLVEASYVVEQQLYLEMMREVVELVDHPDKNEILAALESEFATLDGSVTHLSVALSELSDREYLAYAERESSVHRLVDADAVRRDVELAILSLAPMSSADPLSPISVITKEQ
jgi:hypothetical protein